VSTTVERVAENEGFLY